MSRLKSPWVIVVLVSAGAFMTTLDATALTVALPSLAHDLAASSSALAWIADAYMLTFGGLLLLAGSMSDYFGRKRVLMVGLAVFALASLWASTASSPSELIAARALMGFGSAAIQPAALPTINRIFADEEQRTKAVSLWGTAVATGALLGPVVGGTFVRWYGWEGIFLINLPVGAIALIGIGYLMPETRDTKASAAFDVGGAILVTIGVATMLFAIIETPVRGFLDVVIFAALAVNTVALAAFRRWEQRQASPMLDLRLFQNRSFAHGSANMALLFFAALGTLYLMTQYFQDVQGHSAVVTGLLMLPYAGGLFATMYGSARLIRAFGIRAVARGGGLALGVGILALSYIEASTPAWVPGILLGLAGIGVGMVMSSSVNAIRGSLPPERGGGAATAVTAAMRTLGGAFGIALVGSVATWVYRIGMRDTIASLPPAVAEAAGDRVGAAVAVGDVVGPAVTELARLEFVHAMRPALYVGAAFALLIVLSARGLPKHGAASSLPEAI